MQYTHLHNMYSVFLKLMRVLNCLDFVKEAVADIENLNEEFKSVMEVIGRLAVHFGEEVKKFNVDECFALLGNFFERIDVAAKVIANSCFYGQCHFL